MASSHDADTEGITRRKSLSALAGAGALALAGCTQSTGGGSGDALSGSINIAGSSTVFPLMSAIGEDFAAEHDQVSVDISSTGSGGGFSNYFCVGDTDFNNASRPIQPAEEELCEENGVEYVELSSSRRRTRSRSSSTPRPTGSTPSPSRSSHRSGRRTPPRPGTRSATSSRTRRSSGSAPPTPPGRTTTSSRAFWRSAVTLATTKRPSRTTRSHRASRAASTRSATSASRTTSRTPISSRRSGSTTATGRSSRASKRRPAASTLPFPGRCSPTRRSSHWQGARRRVRALLRRADDRGGPRRRRRGIRARD